MHAFIRILVRVYISESSARAILTHANGWIHVWWSAPPLSTSPFATQQRMLQGTKEGGMYPRNYAHQRYTAGVCADCLGARSRRCCALKARWRREFSNKCGRKMYEKKKKGMVSSFCFFWWHADAPVLPLSSLSVSVRYLLTMRPRVVPPQAIDCRARALSRRY